MQDNTKKPIVEETASTSNVAGADAASVTDDKTPVKEPVKPVSQPVAPVETTPEPPAEELEAPEKPEEIEAPKEELIETKEEDGKTEITSNVVKDEETKETSAKTPSDKAPAASDAGKWYIIHTYSGHENKVAKSLKQRIESMGFEERVFDIIVPTRETVKVSQGKKETIKEKIFPGYVLVKMILDDESWLLVRTTQGVTAFIGAGNKPTPISDKEVAAIQKFMAEQEPLYKTSFTIGEAVKIVDGPFTDFLGAIDNIDEAKGKLKVLVSIFGRETPVELDFLQVSKL